MQQINHPNNVKIPKSVRRESALCIRAAFLPADGHHAQAVRVTYDASPDVGSSESAPEGGQVRFTATESGENGPLLLFSGREFLAIVDYLVDEGWLAQVKAGHNGNRPSDKGDGPPEPSRPNPGIDEEAAGEAPEIPFPFPDLVEGSVDRTLLDDPAWLRAMHHGHDLSAADIARLCGVSFPTVKLRLKKHEIPYVSHRGQPSRFPA